MKTPEGNEKEVMSLFKYGYFDTVLSGRCGVNLDRVKELRVLYEEERR